jgi:hypothetical protein
MVELGQDEKTLTKALINAIPAFYGKEIGQGDHPGKRRSV